MNGNVLRCVAVCVAGGLLLAASASAQFSSQVKVSDVIEGTGNPAGVSAARCGSNVVVGFGDKEPGSGSSAGFAVSKNGGSSFSDLGALSDPSLTFGGGDSPVIGCANASTFYYATRGFVQTASGTCAAACSEIVVSPSTNGGSSWGTGVVASAGTNDIYSFLSPAFAVDPTNPQRLYVAYINNNFVPPYFGCGSMLNGEYILEVVTSTDGGKTWNGRPDPAQSGTSAKILQPDYACDDPDAAAEHRGSLVAPVIVVSPGGNIYVAYEFVTTSFTNAPPPPNEIRFTRSIDGGKTFSAPIAVSKDAISNALPELAVDRTNSPHRGQIFLTWSGEPAGTYTSVLESDSLNAGQSFSFPRAINGTPGAGLGRFQANPAIAADNDGQVQICYYNTPTNTPTSTSVYSYNCATSFNHAATWQLQRVANSAPAGFDAVTTDFLTHHDGFFNAFELQANGTSRVVGQFSDIN